jgi:hypothetical protein
LGASAYLGASAVDFAGPSAFLPSVSISKNGEPTSIVSPTLAKSYVRVPASGDLMSTVILSVSTIATTSSNATYSPISNNISKLNLLFS